MNPNVPAINAAEEEVLDRVRLLRQEEPSLTLSEAVNRTLEEHPDLYAKSLERAPASSAPAAAASSEQRATPMQPQAFAEQVILDSAQDRARERDIPLGQAVDEVLTERPELYLESLGQDPPPLTLAQHQARDIYWGR